MGKILAAYFRTGGRKAAAVMVVIFAACFSVTNNMEGAAQRSAGGFEQNAADMEGKENAVMQLKIDDIVVAVEWESNESVETLEAFCKDRPLEIQMSMYGGFEQVGAIGQSLPENNAQITTQSGDIVLYSGDQIVIFYGSNSWAYTRLGKITGQTADDMERLLGNGDVTITISGKNTQ